MNIEEIDKWLDNEYGCSYTRLEELHDFVIDQDLKHREEADKEIQKLNNIIQKAIKKLENEIKYLEHLDKIGAMYSTEQNRFNNSLLQELKGSDKE